jgi:uridine kinase
MTVKNPEETKADIEKLAAESDSPILVVFDGRSGTGKTTITKEMSEQLGATVILGDDFYAGGTLQEWSQRTAKEKADQCIDWRRLRSDALLPLLAGQAATWHTFNWQTLQGLSDATIHSDPAKIIILDGAYSSRAELAELYSLSVLVMVDEDVRRQRIEKREGSDFVREWHPVWDEAEDYYFGQVRPAELFDIVIKQPVV